MANILHVPFWNVFSSMKRDILIEMLLKVVSQGSIDNISPLV